LKAGLGKVKSSGRTFQEELDSEELDLSTPSRRETGARIYMKLSAMGKKLRVALTAEAKGRANAAIAEMRRKKELPRLCRRVYKRGGDCEQRKRDSHIEQQCQSSSDNYSTNNYIL